MLCPSISPSPTSMTKKLRYQLTLSCSAKLQWLQECLSPYSNSIPRSLGPHIPQDGLHKREPHFLGVENVQPENLLPLPLSVTFGWKRPGIWSCLTSLSGSWLQVHVDFDNLPRFPRTSCIQFQFTQSTVPRVPFPSLLLPALHLGSSPGPLLCLAPPMRLMAPLRFGGHWNGFERYDLVFYRFIFTYLISSSKGK